MPWHVVEANNPRLAKPAIEQLGIVVFMPEYVKRVSHGRKSELVRKPLLYGYMFAQFELSDPQWPLIFSRQGVRSVMCDAHQRPRAVPDAQVDQVRREAAKFDDVVCEEIPLTKDQVVRIIDGIWADRNGIVLFAEDGSDIIVVETEMFRRQVKVTVPRAFVAPLSA